MMRNRERFVYKFMLGYKCLNEYIDFFYQGNSVLKELVDMSTRLSVHRKAHITRNGNGRIRNESLQVTAGKIRDFQSLFGIIYYASMSTEGSVPHRCSAFMTGSAK
jgi:hypothetical protein